VVKIGLVYCTNCGAENEDDAKFCRECGTNLNLPRKGFEERIEDWGEKFGEQAEKWGEEFGRTFEEGCFKIPYFGTIIGLIIGIMIIGVGISFILGVWWEPFFPIMVIVFGLLIVFGILYGLGSRRKGMKS